MFRVFIRDMYNTSKQRKVGSLTWALLAVAFVMVTVLVALFAELADEVLENPTLPVDTAILEVARSIRTPQLDKFVSIATDAGGVIGVASILTLGLIWLIAKKEYRAMVQLLLGVLGAVAINLILKSLFMRERPDILQQIIHEASYSFPSGHAMASSALAISLAIIFWHTSRRGWIIAGLVGYMILIGLSRVYLGVHYPSDIVAGWLVSTSWVITVAVLMGVIKIKKTTIT